MRQRGGGDLHVVTTDELTLTLQIGAEFRVTFGAGPVERPLR